MKLDSLSKILIATGQVNYMAAIIYGVDIEMKFIPEPKKIHGERISERSELLDKVVVKLSAIMEDMGNLINNHDCICNIDERVTKVPFEILISGMDETDEIYGNEEHPSSYPVYTTPKFPLK